MGGGVESAKFPACATFLLRFSGMSNRHIRIVRDGPCPRGAKGGNIIVLDVILRLNPPSSLRYTLGRMDCVVVTNP
jgi:hypothetical protein